MTPLLGLALNAHHLDDPAIAGLLHTYGIGTITAENHMKLGFVMPSPWHLDFTHPDRFVAFAASHGLALRGHTLFWHGWNPDWVEHVQMDRGGWTDLMWWYTTEYLKRYRGMIWHWDVVNESDAEHGATNEGYGTWGSRLGPGWMDNVFRWAHDADPGAVLFYNDFYLETMNERSDRVYALVRGMLDRGVPIGGMGFQGHIIAPHNAPWDDHVAESVRQNVTRFRDLGLRIAITEADVLLHTGQPSLEQLAEQAAVFGGLARIARDVGADSFTAWGIRDQDSWVTPVLTKMPDAPLLFDNDYRPKPAYYAVKQFAGVGGERPEEQSPVDEELIDFPLLMPAGFRVIGSGDITTEDGGGNCMLHACTARWGDGADDWGVVVLQQRGNTVTRVNLRHRYTEGHLVASRGRPYLSGFRPDIGMGWQEQMPWDAGRTG